MSSRTSNIVSSRGCSCCLASCYITPAEEHIRFPLCTIAVPSLALLQTEQWEFRLCRGGKRPPCAGSGPSLGRLTAAVLPAAALPGWLLLLWLRLLCLLATAAATAVAVPALSPTEDQGAERRANL